MSISTAHPDTPPTATELLDSLDSLAIRKRLAELDAEQSALRVLLRAAVARERRLKTAAAQREQGAAHA